MSGASVTVRCNRCGATGEVDGRPGAAARLVHRPGCSEEGTVPALPPRHERRRLVALERRRLATIERANERAEKTKIAARAACWRCSGRKQIPIEVADTPAHEPIRFAPCPVCCQG